MKKLSETKFFSGLERHSNVPDKVVAILLAFIPLLQHYKGFLAPVAAAVLGEHIIVSYLDRLNLAASVMLLLGVYLFLRVLPRLNKKYFRGAALLAPLLAFYVYKIVDHGTSIEELVQVGLPLCYLIAAAFGCIDVKTVAKAVSCVAGFAGVAMVAQYICFYGFGFHLQLIPTGLLMPPAQQWAGLAQTGLISVNGNTMDFYRPAGFFMEPSHVFLYCFPALFMNLYRQKRSVWNWIISLLASMGIVMSTSGMGVATVFAAWVLFSILWDEKADTLTLKGFIKWQNWLRTAGVALALLAVFLLVPSINSSIARIVGLKSIELVPSDGTETMPDLPDNLEEFLGDKNAVSGRVTGALELLKEMSLKQWIIGCADTVKGISSNMPGFMATLYKYGVIGIALSYAFFLYGLKKLNVDYFVITGIWILASFFSAHSHSMMFMLYYVLLLCRGHEEGNGQWQKELVRTFRFLTFRKPE